MSKAFTKETDQDDDDLPAGVPPIPPGSKNYMTPKGHRRMLDELRHLVSTERPELVNIVSWAASNGDRSENGDYIYGKRKLREIDRRIRFLTKRLETAEVVDTERKDTDQVFFGATVTFNRDGGDDETISIVGLDEINPAKGYVSWISPIARTLTKAREGDTVILQTPEGPQELDIVLVEYKELD
ncbi:transcription elongation factor GreB [Leeia sp. TBRC 13508]|uniref:Transcription elongation factor GreB n=1 Tax=Leeia speluncae TaxID=2884804 RepID=A0ABS8D5A5_9NEIS|nr:transcription elongation factor GreB [Leeia speluncae]MCB6183312.1 transcription elongation factor GreB [Leeia speluncae]